MANIPINMNQYNTNNTPGYTFAANSDVVTVGFGFLVGSMQGIGVYAPATYNSDTLINNGIILSGLNDGINW